MNDGFIKLYRKLLSWEWYCTSNMVQVLIHLVLKANFIKKKWRGIDIERGQFITGIKQLSTETGISPQSLRTCLFRLKSTSEITIKSTNKYSIITVCNYDSYQSIKPQEQQTEQQTTNKQLTNKQQTTNKQLTTTKNDNNINNDNNEKREEEKKEILNPKNDIVYNYDYFRVVYLNENTHWLDTNCMLLNLSKESAKKYLAEFIDEIQMKELVKTEQDFKVHFVSWLKKKIEIQKPNQNKYGKENNAGSGKPTTTPIGVPDWDGSKPRIAI